MQYLGFYNKWINFDKSLKMCNLLIYLLCSKTRYQISNQIFFNLYHMINQKSTVIKHRMLHTLINDNSSINKLCFKMNKGQNVTNKHIGYILL